MTSYSIMSTAINFKIFVKETNDENPPKSKSNTKYLRVSSLTGDKAKEFYEELIKDSSKQKKCVNAKQNGRPTRKTVEKTFKSTDLLRMAQNNDVKNLEIILTQNNKQDINIIDEFGWTPLMCASCSGAEGAVMILLKSGADPHKRDRSGETALSLARKKNHQKIVKILQEFTPECEPVQEKALEEPQSFFCPICKGNFEVDKNKHETSTVHLFNCPFKTSTFYGIPETNKGFQLLLREGWDKEKGLGRDGSGRKFPIKAVMKKDRMGIGATPPERLIKTEQNDNKRRKIYTRWKEKNFEKNFRLEFS